MKQFLSIALIAFLSFVISPAYSSKSFDWELEFSKIEKEYVKGDYKKIVSRSQALIKKIEKNYGNESMPRAKALAQLAKIYEALSKFDDYSTTINLSLNTIDLSPKENSEEYAKTLTYVTETFIQYGDYVAAHKAIEKATALILEGKVSSPVLVNEIKSKQVEVLFHQGYLQKAEAAMEDLINFSKARVVSKEPFKDSKGNTKEIKLSKAELEKRKRRVADLLNLYSLITLSNGNYSKTDSLLIQNASYIKKNFGKKDVAYLENTFQRGLLLEALHKNSESNDKFERVGNNSSSPKGIKWKPMSKQVIRIQEKRILSHRLVKRDGQAKKRTKIYETRATRTYGKNSIYYAKSELLDAEGYILSKDYRRAETRVEAVLNNPLYFPKKHSERIRALKLLYTLSMETDQYGKAESTLEQIIELTKTLYGANVPASDLAYISLANFHVMYSSKFKQAEEIYNLNFVRVNKEIDHRHKDFLPALYSISSLYEYTDRFEKALEVLTLAIDDTKKYYGENHPKYAAALERTANIYIDLGRYSDAEKNLITSAEIFRKEGSKGDYTEYSHALVTYARFYIIQGQYEDAKKMLRKSVQKQNVAGGNVKLSGAIEELATLYIETGKYQETESDLKQSLKIKEAKYGVKHRTLINPLNQLGHLYLITGKFIEAEKNTKRAASISLEIFGPSSLKFAESLKLLGNIYSSVGDYEKAEDALEKALTIQKQQYGQKHIQVAMSLNDIALVKYYNKADANEVEKLFLEALSIAKESLGDKHPGYASILANLASFYLESNRLDEAEENLNQANAIWVAKLGENNIHSSEIYFIKGNASCKRKNYAQAKLDYVSSRNINQKVFDNSSHPGYLSAVSKIGQMSFIVGDHKEAVRCLDETTSNYLNYIQKYFPALSEREKTKFWTKIQSDFEFYNTLAIKLKDTYPDLVSKAYNNALSTKSLLLNSSIKVRQYIMDSKDQELINKFEEWVGKKEFLTSAIALTLEQRKESGTDLKVLETEIENLEKELSARSEAFAKNFQKKDAYDWRDIRKNLAANEVAIEIVRFRKFHKDFTDSITYAALIITPESKTNPTLVSFSSGKDMERKSLNYYRNCMKYNVEDKLSYNVYWKPIKSQIKDHAKVYFSPDGVYNQINIETLLSENRNFVLDQNEVVLVSNTRDLITRKLENEKAAKASKSKNNSDVKETHKIALFGNPTYYSAQYSAIEDSTSTELSSILHRGDDDEKKKVSQLAGAEKEVRDLHDLLNKNGWNSEAFISEEATEAKLKDLKDVKVLHIATHGFFMDNEDLSSDMEGINKNRAVENPLHRCGILLKDGGYLMNEDNVYQFNSTDGILTAYEAMNLSFDNTDLVVLSACETGLGMVQQGEGVFGLQRSFLVAGSKSVIMSLFKVSDEVTQELMNTFYEKWIGTGNKRQAFIDAKKAIKEKYHRPIYWGAFIMVGLE